MSFETQNHTLIIDEEKIDRILVPAAKFFMTTTKYDLRNLPAFSGAGIYALYLNNTADTIYEGRLTPDYPIYVGKAVPSGSRQGRNTSSNQQLRTRLAEHRRSIGHGGIPIDNFSCRFMIMTGVAEDLISATESVLIRMFRPLWNSHIDGFGNHTPGAGRWNQQPSEWDTLHPGRPWCKNLTGAPRDQQTVLLKIQQYEMRNIG